VDGQACASVHLCVHGYVGVDEDGGGGQGNQRMHDNAVTNYIPP
jgi:hypothetical protein